MIGFASLGSGSRGNGTLIRCDRDLLLIDCGFSLKETERRLARLDARPGDIAAIFVTHEHADHIAGVASLAHKYAIPAYASHGTLKAARVPFRGQALDPEAPIRLGAIDVIPVTVPHDAREPLQFVVQYAGSRIGVISDLGHVTPHVLRQYGNLDGLMMEANHDREMLWNGAYPPRLKSRVGGPLGHLSNDQAAEFLGAVARSELDVCVGHVSEQNNSRAHLERMFDPLRSSVRSLKVATQRGGVGWIDVASRQLDLAADAAPA